MITRHRDQELVYMCPSPRARRGGLEPSPGLPTQGHTACLRTRARGSRNPGISDERAIRRRRRGRSRVPHKFIVPPATFLLHTQLHTTTYPHRTTYSFKALATANIGHHVQLPHLPGYVDFADRPSLRYVARSTSSASQMQVLIGPPTAQVMSSATHVSCRPSAAPPDLAAPPAAATSP
ncbi:hypothetical protein EVG20_g5020 [Dentipellis fragilis]|uniref:Uncharacterized protein n=1 Tax=Dentipellis fragilis TaxID=205917 RepID=A0A4Y9YY66_9AGAM|nr:hypothetical protein EVG20_g5020 [Dentipellis fragilis]